jgi:hypothetical protein
MAVSIKITTFWDMKPCNLIASFQELNRTYCMILKKEAADSAELLVAFHQSTWSHIPELPKSEHTNHTISVSPLPTSVFVALPIRS